MERGRSRKARSGCLGRIFGFVLFLIVAAVGVIAAVKYSAKPGEGGFGCSVRGGRQRPGGAVSEL